MAAYCLNRAGANGRGTACMKVTLRESDSSEQPLLEQDLMVSIAGIATGLRNTD